MSTTRTNVAADLQSKLRLRSGNPATSVRSIAHRDGTLLLVTGWNAAYHGALPASHLGFPIAPDNPVAQTKTPR